MTTDDERYVMTIGTDKAVRLRDQKTGEKHHFPAGPRALWHALGVLAEWRERDELLGDPTDTVWFGPADHPGRAGLPLAHRERERAACPYDSAPMDCPFHGPENPIPCSDLPGYNFPLDTHDVQCRRWVDGGRTS